MDVIATSPRPVDPCNPDPCGPNSQCLVVGKRHRCECLQGYFGSAPNCRPECRTNSDCPRVKACINRKCRDPCVGTCGTEALCEITNHNPVCYCPKGLTGDPFLRCFKPLIGEYMHVSVDLTFSISNPNNNILFR